MTRCARCGGACVDRDEDGPFCINCGRPCTPVVPLPQPLSMRAAHNQERQFIKAQIEAAQRALAI